MKVYCIIICAGYWLCFALIESYELYNKMQYLYDVL